MFAAEFWHGAPHPTEIHSSLLQHLGHTSARSMLSKSISRSAARQLYNFHKDAWPALGTPAGTPRPGARHACPAPPRAWRLLWWGGCPRACRRSARARRPTTAGSSGTAHVPIVHVAGDSPFDGGAGTCRTAITGRWAHVAWSVPWGVL